MKYIITIPDELGTDPDDILNDLREMLVFEFSHDITVELLSDETGSVTEQV